MQLEEIQPRERGRTGKRLDKPELLQEALDLLMQNYSKAEWVLRTWSVPACGN
jgi:hypothetical protein